MPGQTPFRFTGFNVVAVSNYGASLECSAAVDGESVWFTGPATAPPADATDWHEQDYDAAALAGTLDTTGIMDIGSVFRTLPNGGVDVQPGQALYAGLRIHTEGHGDDRSCAQTCKGEPHDDADLWFTGPAPDGTASPCPGPGCEWVQLVTLSGSPSPEYFFRAFGYAL